MTQKQKISYIPMIVNKRKEENESGEHTNNCPMEHSWRRRHGWEFKLLFQKQISMAYNLVHLTIQGKYLFTNL